MPSSSQQRTAIQLCALLSGAAGLAYEVLWMRSLDLVLGGSAEAIAGILAVFLGGLGLGAVLFSRIAHRLRAPLLAYALVEAAIALAGVSVPAFLASVPEASAQLLGSSRGALLAGNAFLASVCILVPATLMGASLPLLCAVPLHRERGPGERAGTIYGLNTLGAVLGTLTTGLVFLPELGMRGASLVAGGANAGAALLAGSLAAASRLGPSTHTSGLTSPDVRSSSLVGIPIAAGLLGLSGMVYEVAWTRSLALVFGSTTEAFSLMLGAYLLGTAVGSGLASRRCDRSRRPLETSALLLLVSVIAGMGGLLLLPEFPHLLLRLFAHTSNPTVLRWGQLGMALILMVPVTLSMGAAFPLLSLGVERRGRPLSEAVGVVYAANTLGAIGGAVAASLWAVPMLGPEGSIKSAVLLGLAASTVLYIVSRSFCRFGFALATAAVGGLVSLTAYALPPWDPAVMSSTVYTEGPRYLALFGQPQNAFLVLKRYPRLFDRHGKRGLVSVVDRSLPAGEAHLVLTIDGKIEASTAADMPTQVLVAHLPLALAENPRRALVIGLASGVTAGSALANDRVQELEIVEIEPAVAEAARYFEGFNRHVLSDARARLAFGDGRNHLLLHRRKYDAIISEPSNPWLAGSAAIFTREFWSLARDRLEPGGVLAQWVQLYALPTEELRRLARTFVSVFPQSYLFQTTPGDAVLIGFREPRALRYEAFEDHFRDPSVRADLARVGVRRPAQMLSMLRLSPASLKEFGGEGALNTDANNRVEFAAARALHIQSQEDNAKLLMDLSVQFWKEVVQFPASEDDRREALLSLARSDLESGLFERAEAALRRLLEEAPSATAYELLGRLFAKEGSRLSAEEAWSRGVATDAYHADGLRLLLAESFVRRGAYREALVQTSQLSSKRPEARLLIGLAQFGLSHFEKSAAILPGSDGTAGSSIEKWALVPFYRSKALEALGREREAGEEMRRSHELLRRFKQQIERTDPAELSEALGGLQERVILLRGHESAPDALARLRDSVLEPLDAYLNGVMLYALGRDEEALSEFVRYQALSPDHESAAAIYLRALEQPRPSVTGSTP